MLRRSLSLSPRRSVWKSLSSDLIRCRNARGKPRIAGDCDSGLSVISLSSFLFDVEKGCRSMAFTAEEWRDRTRDYESLRQFSVPLFIPEHPIVGRDRERRQVMAGLSRPEMSNVILLANAGTGKTALVQLCARQDPARVYLEVDLPRMVAAAGQSDLLAAKLKAFFDEAEAFAMSEKTEDGDPLGLVLFIDEFHQIPQFSKAAVEVLKPVLAQSGARGIRVIAATTDTEFDQYIKVNQPLVERLSRISLAPPDQDSVVDILRSRAKSYGILDQFFGDGLFRMIHELTELYVPASSQPRKSIQILDAMVGWHRFADRTVDYSLLVEVLRETYNIDIGFQVDAVGLKKSLDDAVFAQDYATSVVARRLQLCVAGLHNRKRPMGSFLFTGGTGVGKTELAKQMSRVMFGDDVRHFIRIDMSEFSQNSSVDRLRYTLTELLFHMSHAVILIDEIEKGAQDCTRLLLQMLDDGQLSDELGRRVSFLNSYIIMTTNMASEIYESISEYSPSDSGTQLANYEKVIRQSLVSGAEKSGLPPEILGRIDSIVPFQPLSENTYARIVDRELRSMVKDVWRLHQVRTRIDRRVAQWLIKDLSEIQASQGGARRMISQLNSTVKTDLAVFINAHPEEKDVFIDIEGELISENKFRRSSDAHPVVRAVRV